MAHRKPLGSTFTSTFDWEGPHPWLEDFLVSAADTWYRVVGVQEKANPRRVGLTLERIAKPAWPLSEHDGQVHEFVWYDRGRRRS